MAPGVPNSDDPTPAATTPAVPTSNDPTATPGRRRCAVLGSPIAHSLSPVLHRAAYAALGIDWSYDAIECTETELPAFLAACDSSWAGLSLTMPLKTAVLPLLDDVDPTAQAVRAVNTVLFEPGDPPRRVGFNTDVAGMLAALGDHGVTHAHEAVVLGGGATARSALAALHELAPAAVTCYVRDPRRTSDLKQLAERLDLPVAVQPWERAAGALDADLVVATTPAGATDHLAAVGAHRGGTLFDVVYDPWPTPLTAAWATAGGRVVSGADLLLHQAAGQVELMTGRPAPLSAMRQALEQAAGAP